MTRVLQAFERAAGVILVFSVFIVVVIQVFYRYVLNSPIFWSDELASYLFIWMVLIGMAYAQGMKAHVKMDLISSRLPKEVGRFVGIALNILILVFLISCLRPSLRLVNLMMRFRTPGLRVSWAFVLMSAPVCFGLLGLHVIDDTIGLVRDLMARHGRKNTGSSGRAS